MPEMFNRGIPPKVQARTVQTNAVVPTDRPDDTAGSGKKRKPLGGTKRATPTVEEQDVFATADYLRLIFKGFSRNNSYPDVSCDNWRWSNIAKAVHCDRTVCDYLVSTFIKDWHTIREFYPEAAQYKIPSPEVLDRIKYRLTLEISEGAYRYPNAMKDLSVRPWTVLPVWLDEFRVKSESEGMSSFKDNNYRKAQITQKVFDITKAYYVSPDDLSDVPDFVYTGPVPLSGVVLEKPGSHIKHGCDPEKYRIDLFTPCIPLDVKGKPLFPSNTIRVNGPGTDPVLSKYFGYLPDGKYQKSQHESPEAFEHHKLLVAESLAFFTTVPRIFSKMVGVQDKVNTPLDYDREYQITIGIGQGLPRLGYLTQMITQMGFTSWEQCWDWHITGYTEYVWHKMASPKFYGECHGKQPFYTYDFRRDGTMGLNPCEDILDKPLPVVLNRTEPYKPVFRWHDDSPPKSVAHLLGIPYNEG